LDYLLGIMQLPFRVAVAPCQNYSPIPDRPHWSFEDVKKADLESHFVADILECKE
jgi:hypothetical protein